MILENVRYGSVNLLDDSLVIEAAEKRFVARREGPDILFMAPDQREVIGHIYLGSSHGGAMYLGRECIAEFDRVDDHYVIRPVMHGRLDPHQRIEADPIEYFVSFLTK